MIIKLFPPRYHCYPPSLRYCDRAAVLRALCGNDNLNHDQTTSLLRAMLSGVQLQLPIYYIGLPSHRQPCRLSLLLGDLFEKWKTGS